MHGRFTIWRGGALFIVAVSCSTSPAPPLEEPPRYTLDTYCEESAPRFCHAIAGCCAASLAGFDQASCERFYVENLCYAEAQAVELGITTFALDGMPNDRAEAMVAGCFDAFAELAAMCDEADYYDGRRFDAQRLFACRPIFPGTAELGESCTGSRECNPGPEPGIVECVDGVCRETSLWAAGGECPSPNFACEEGYACQADPSGDRRCLPVTPLGESCNPIRFNAECGFGNHCDFSDAICKPAPGGAGEPCDASGRFTCRSAVCAFHQDLTCSHPMTWTNWLGATPHALSDAMCGVSP